MAASVDGVHDSFGDGCTRKQKRLEVAVAAVVVVVVASSAVGREVVDIAAREVVGGSTRSSDRCRFGPFVFVEFFFVASLVAPFQPVAGSG